MNGFYLLDKPLDFTSFDLLKVLRKKIKVKRIGHTGTLDPLATGGLLVAVGNYTKLIPYFEKDTKEYVFSVNFDGISDSFDLGTPVEYISTEAQQKAKQTITKEKIQKLLESNFTGTISQIPPKYSALKLGGKRALERVIAGEEFEMKSRHVTISNIELLDYNYPKAQIKATVSAGTYIRSIAFDLGELLGTGAYVTELKRTKIGSLDLSLAQTLENFDKEKYLDIKDLFKNKKFFSIQELIILTKENIIEDINNGLKITGNFNLPIGEDFFICRDNLVTNIITYDGENIIPKRKI